MDDTFLDQMDQALTGWPDPAARLRSALDNDELTLYCQPIRALDSGAFPIAEALVRLREEEDALLPPGEFLPAFEYYRMMPQLDRWVVRKAAAHLARGSKIPRLSVNVSGQTLEDAAFSASVASTLAKAGVAPAALLFEINEADILSRPDAAARFASDTRAIGAGVMIDGFGRKAVSFAPLKTLRADFIKVDGCITRKILSSETADKKLRAIVRVAETLGIGVVSECVEDQAILIRLKALGVGYAQGFGILRPHPLDSVAG